MRFGDTDRVFCLTGAGISAESGLATFRGSGGLWNGYRVRDVATPQAWEADPALVWKFYSMRRRDALAAKPNAGHSALARLEERLRDRLFLCTQNVDDLHEQSGSGQSGGQLHHMHGELFQSRCVRCEQPFADRAVYEGALPTCEVCGSAIRPHIVWFGEEPLDLDRIYAALERATHFLVVGTSGSVYPAAGFVEIARRAGVKTLYVGPERPINAQAFDEIVLGTAVEALPGLVD